MTKECSIVKDLYVLYSEAEISADTRKFIEDHMKECETCREYYGKMDLALENMGKADADISADRLGGPDAAGIVKKDLSTAGFDEQSKLEEKRIRRSFRKIKKRWLASLVLVVLLTPILSFCVRLTVNQISGWGLRYTNIDEVLMCEKYFKYLKKGEYQKAAALMADWKLKEYKERKYEIENAEDYYGKEVDIYHETWIKTRPEIDDITDADTYYKDAIFSCREGVLIPENIWKKYVKEEYLIEEYLIEGVGTSNHINYYVAEKSLWEEYHKEKEDIDFQNNIFVKISTDWGEYYVCREQHSISNNVNGEEEPIVWYVDESIDADNVEAELLYQLFDYIPSDAYKEAVRNLTSERAEEAELFYKDYRAYENMSDNEIKENLIEYFAKRLENYFDEGYKIIDIDYFDDDQYEVVYNERYASVERISVKIKDKNGVIQKGVFTVFTNGNQLMIADCDSSNAGIRRLFDSIVYFDFLSEG